jgi:hypothetical protein
LRAFPDTNDADVTGEFQFSNHKLVSEDVYYNIYNHAKSVKVKLDNKLMLHIVAKNDNIVLSVERSDNTEQYCINLSDETEKSQYLNDKYYKQTFIKKHEKGMFLYKDSFSKTFMESDTMLMQLNLFKLIPTAKKVTTEETYIKIKENNFLKSLAKKYE